MIYLYELSQAVKFIEAESRVLVARGWDREKWEVAVQYRVSVMQEEKVLEVRRTMLCL